MPIKAYTTKVPLQRTLHEIMGILASHGAQKVQVEYGEQSQPIALAFIVNTPVGERAFLLPSNIEGVQRTLVAQKVERRYQEPSHAANVAWRILRDWVAAQMAIIEAGMVSIDQVMLPYMLVGESGQHTLYAAMIARQLSLPDKTGS